MFRNLLNLSSSIQFLLQSGPLILDFSIRSHRNGQTVQPHPIQEPQQGVQQGAQQLSPQHGAQHG